MNCRHIIALAAVAALSISIHAAQPAASPPRRSAEVQRQVDALIRQLSAGDWQSRQKAQEELVQMGPDVVPDLRKLEQSTRDEEVRSRAAAAALQIESTCARFVQFSFTPNADVIAERHAAPGDPGASVGIDIGGSCYLSNSEARFRGRGRGKGLPDDGRINEVQLLPYDQNNVARRTDGKPIEIKVPAGRYHTVIFYACVGSDTNQTVHGASMTATLAYATGDPVDSTFLVSDWALRRPEDTYLVEHTDRTLWTREAMLAVGWEDRPTDYAIFSVAITIDPARKLTGISLARTGESGIVNLFAVGGMAMADPANPPFAQAANRPAPGDAIKPPAAGRPERFVQFRFTPNADLVIERLPGPNDFRAQSGLDYTNACFLSEKMSIAAARQGGFGLPDDGRIDNVQLMPYGRNNAARRTDDTPIEVDVLPGRYSMVTIHGCAGRERPGPFEGAQMTVTLVYATGAVKNVNFTIPESFAQPRGSTFLISTLARLRGQPGERAGMELRLPGWNIFSCPIAADPARRLTRVRLARTGDEGIVSVFAVSGMAVEEK